MKNNQLLPFERNRYYAGKVLTSTDFVAEQLYMNNKRRFLNRVMYGSGVVCGLNVINLDDISILVESGAAIDEAGREIVVESSVVKKLSALEGYDTLNGGRAYLCLRYREEDVHPVYRASAGVHDGAGSEYECNRIDEGYELYLMNAKQWDVSGIGMEDEFLFEKTILDDEDFLLKLRIPAVVPGEVAVKFVFEVCKKSARPVRLSFHAVFQMPVFTDEGGNHTLNVDLEDISLKEGETAGRDYWVNVETSELKETSLLARKEEIRICENQRAVEPGEDISIRLALVRLSPEELATREIGKLNLEMRSIRQRNDVVRLAELVFSRPGGAYLISGIREQGIKNYIATPGELCHRSRYLSYFRGKPGGIPQRTKHEEAPGAERLPEREMPVLMAGGTLEIPLNVKMKKGEVCYSEEITHGLGRGNVYVAVGMDCGEEHPGVPAPLHDTIYGDASMFGGLDLMELDTAVKVMKDKGSFQVAVRLRGEQKSIVAALSWVAVRFAQKEEAGEEEAVNMRIVPKHPTIQLGAGDSYFFEVAFENMQPCALSYELTEAGSGEIDGDGVYRAPAKEGVYEILIYCTDKPRIFTYVYAIVSRAKH